MYLFLTKEKSKNANRPTTNQKHKPKIESKGSCIDKYVLPIDFIICINFDINNLL